MAPLDQVELTKMQTLLEHKNENKNEKQAENKNENILLLIIDNSSIISSGTMNAKLPLWTAIVQLLPVKVLVCVYIDLSSPKSPNLQTIGLLPNAISNFPYF